MNTNIENISYYRATDKEYSSVNTHDEILVMQLGVINNINYIL